MLKIIAACGAGMGTSMVIRLKLVKILKEIGVEGSVESMSMGQARSMSGMCDIIFTSLHLVSEFNQVKGTKVVGVKNLMDEAEIRASLSAAISSLRDGEDS